jgi:hypothetical protein
LPFTIRHHGEPATRGTPSHSISPLDGTWIPWTREDGDIDRITGRWSYPTLVVYFQGEDGARVHKYELDPDGRTLKLYVELTSPRLPAPIDYTLVYRRQ